MRVRFSIKQVFPTQNNITNNSEGLIYETNLSKSSFLQLSMEYAEDPVKKADKLVLKGIEFVKSNQHEQAITCYNNAIKINPKDRDAHIFKGNSLIQLDMYAEAIEQWNKAIEIDPDYALVWNIKGNLLYKMGKTEDAIVCFDKALEIDPKKEFTWNSMGFALSKLDRYEEAIVCFDKALENATNEENRKGFQKIKEQVIISKNKKEKVKDT